MHARPLVMLAAMALGLSAPGPALAQAEVTHVLRLWAEGANLFADTCPLSNPDVDTACTAYVVFYSREDLPEGGLLPPDVPGGRAKALFNAIAEIDDVVVHPDGTADGSVRAFGILFDANGTSFRAQASSRPSRCPTGQRSIWTCSGSPTAPS